MNNRHHGMIRMNNYRHAGSKKLVMLHVQRFFHRMRKLPIFCREVNTSLIKYAAVFDNSSTSASSAIPLPYFLLERRYTVALFKRSANLVLYGLVFGSYLFLSDHWGKFS